MNCIPPAQVIEVCELRQAMRGVASTVSVVTARLGDEFAGATVTSVTSVALGPPAMLVCVNRMTRLHGTIVAAGSFGINFLATRHQNVADAFGGQQLENRFSCGAWDLSGETPVLRDALATILCKVENTVDFGTHTIFIGRVRSAAVSEGPPLIYHSGTYTQVETKKL